MARASWAYSGGFPRRLGNGTLAANAWDELQRLAELLEAPVVMSIDGRGAQVQLALQWESPAVVVRLTPF